MKAINICLVCLVVILIVSCSSTKRDPAQYQCNPESITNQGTHFEDYERCKDL